MFLMGQRFASFAWRRPFTSDGVIVEGYLLHSELRLAGHDLYAGPLSTTNESFEQLIKLFDGVCACTNVIAIDRKLVPQSFEISFRILQTISILIQKTLPERAVFIKVDIVI